MQSILNIHFYNGSNTTLVISRINPSDAMTVRFSSCFGIPLKMQENGLHLKLSSERFGRTSGGIAKQIFGTKRPPRLFGSYIKRTISRRRSHQRNSLSTIAWQRRASERCEQNPYRTLVPTLADSNSSAISGLLSSAAAAAAMQSHFSKQQRWWPIRRLLSVPRCSPTGRVLALGLVKANSSPKSCSASVKHVNGCCPSNDPGGPVRS